MDRWRVLLAEDEAVLARIIVDMLAELPLDVSVAKDGPDALRQVQAIQPDLILLDVLMPGLDGFEVARVLKADPATQEIPIIFITARSRYEEKVRGLELGADDYLIKPIKREELLARVRNVLRRVEARRPAAPPEKSLVRGRLEMISLPNVLQALEVERRTGTLRVTSGERHGEILFAEGRIASALEGPRQGEAAVYRMLTWKEGEFSLEPASGTAPPEALVTRSNQSLLLEGMRRLDELAALRQALAPLDGTIRLFLGFRRGLLQRGLSRELHQFVELCDGTRMLPQLVEASPLDEWEILSLLGRFLRLGMLAHAHTIKRGFARLSIQLSVDFQPLKAFTAGTSLDVSAQGIFVRTSQVLPVGEQIMLRFKLPGIAQAFTAVGRVTWSSATDTTEGYPAGMGIQLLDLTGEEQAAIDRYVVETLLDRALAAEPEQ